MQSNEIQEHRKTGRNDPCPCGSGKKFKKCCSSKEGAARVLALPTSTRMTMPKTSGKKVDRENAVPPEIKKEIIEKFLENHYSKWVTDKIPALGNKTPSEMVQTKQGREKVERLIRQMEFGDDRLPADKIQYDFNKLRKKLGLETV